MPTADSATITTVPTLCAIVYTGTCAFHPSTMSATEKKGLAPGSMNPNKLAMSKALGAAFLNHQVEQLEKSVSGGVGNNAGNWRNRRQLPAQVHGAPAMTGKRPPMAPGIKVASRNPEESQAARKAARAQQSKETHVGVKYDAGHSVPRRLVEEEKPERKSKRDKDADVVVVDASVLIHAQYQLKKWCKDGRKEVIIVPLEVLNTLDLLKKGSNLLAQRARSASRILEAQVGANPRIRVQQDDAYVLWDKIKFNDEPISIGADATVLSTSSSSKSNPLQNASPEWVRRTICCALWEVENASTTLTQVTTTTTTTSSSPPKNPSSVLDNNNSPALAAPTSGSPGNASVIFAVVRPTDPSDARTLPKNSDPSENAHLEPVVPLPAPSLPPPNKFEPRVSGSLVAQWASKAGIKILELDPTTPGKGDNIVSGLGDGDAAAAAASAGARGPRHVSPRPANGHGHGKVRRASASIGDGPSHGHGFGHSKGHSGGSGETGLVERPAAVRTMMQMVAQPKTVVRVLARGEKLDP